MYQLRNTAARRHVRDIRRKNTLNRMSRSLCSTDIQGAKCAGNYIILR